MDTKSPHITVAQQRKHVVLEAFNIVQEMFNLYRNNGVRCTDIILIRLQRIWRILHHAQTQPGLSAVIPDSVAALIVTITKEQIPDEDNNVIGATSVVFKAIILHVHPRTMTYGWKP